MLEPYDDSFKSCMSDLAASLRAEEDTASPSDAVQVESHHSHQPFPTISSTYRFHLDELEDNDSFFYDCSHYENDLVCLSEKSCGYEEPSPDLDIVEQTTNFSFGNCSENVENCQPLFSENFPTSSFSCSPESEACAEESNCAETAKELQCEEQVRHNHHVENHFASKGKVNDLQRSALDAIFQITDRPSRVLVLYIASELRLHHVTVKNFFSNARRRVRRAAARLTDPERSKRENRKRKEKRRLAALTLAASSRNAGASGHSLSLEKINENSKDSSSLKMSIFRQCNDSSYDETPLKSFEIVSPKRRALMEKLVDKVQRSAAQKHLANASHLGVRTSSSPQHISVEIVSSESSAAIPTFASQSVSQLPSQLSTTSRWSEDSLANAFPVNRSSHSLCEKNHTTDGISAPGFTIELESCDDDQTKRKEFSPLWHPSLLNMTLEYQPESWDVPSLP